VNGGGGARLRRPVGFAPRAGLAGADVDARLVEDRRLHLGGEEALPDELVELELVAGQEGLEAGRVALRRHRADRLVGLLRALRLLGVDGRPVRHVLGAELDGDDRPRRLLGGGGDVGRVRPHVGDQALGAVRPEVDPLVQLLGDLHRPPHPVAELARGFLLEGAGDERRRRPPLRLPRGDVDDLVRRPVEAALDALRLDPRLEIDLLLAFAGQRRPEDVRLLARRHPPRQLGVERPVLDWLEGLDLPLPLADDPQRGGLDSAGREAALDLFPEQRADAVADERSSTRRACWASTRFGSIARGWAIASVTASGVISWKTTRWSGFW
jgi:hypothetical protein